MINDDVIWDIINHSQCSFKKKTAIQTHCANEYNLTGLCNRSVCPLANSRYATVKEKDDILYLYMKLPERVSYPRDTWERVKLKANVNEALAQIDKHLIYWPKHLIKKVKSRFAVYKQSTSRKRHMELHEEKIIVAKSRKVERNEDRKEIKALKSANLEKTIEDEVLARLAKKNVFYNVNKNDMEKLNLEEVYDSEEEYEYVDGGEDDEEDIEFVDAEESMSEEDIEDLVLVPVMKKTTAMSHRPKIVIQEDSDDE